jgi:hypothetical protein
VRKCFRVISLQRRGNLFPRALLRYLTLKKFDVGSRAHYKATAPAYSNRWGNFHAPRRFFFSTRQIRCFSPLHASTPPPLVSVARDAAAGHLDSTASGRAPMAPTMSSSAPAASASSSARTTRRSWLRACTTLPHDVSDVHGATSTFSKQTFAPLYII